MTQQMTSCMQAKLLVLEQLLMPHFSAAAPRLRVQPQLRPIRQQQRFAANHISSGTSSAMLLQRRRDSLFSMLL